MKAAIYTRVSTNDQAREGFSLEAQRDILMDTLERKGLQLYRIYTDPGVSGGTFKRPGIQALLRDMKAGKFDTLLIHKLDRLSRNIGDLYEFIGLVNKLDIRLIIVSMGSEEIDTRSPMGKAFLMFSGIWAEIYLDNLREETLKGLTKKMQNGGRHMSKPPLGYEFDENYNLLIVENEAKLVRIVYDKYLKGSGVVTIAKHMNEFSRKKEGGVWDHKAVRNILKNPTYAGYNHFKQSHWSEDQRIITEGNHEPIISKEDFEKVKLMMERRSNNHMSKRSFPYPYSGIVRCARCGATYTGSTTVHQTKTKGEYRYRSYNCYNRKTRKTCDGPSISERELHRIVFEKIMFYGDEIKDKKKDQKQDNTRQLEREVDKSNKRKRNWMIALGDGKLSPDDYASLVDEEEKRMQDIYRELEINQAVKEAEIPIEELKQMILNIHKDWDLLDVELQKEFIQSWFREIVIDKKEDKWEVIDMLTV